MVPTSPIFEVIAASADRIATGSKRLRKCGEGLLVDIEPVRDEDEIQPGGFRLAGAFDVEIEVDAGVGRHTWVPPRVHVDAGALKHDAEMDTLAAHNGAPSLSLSIISQIARISASLTDFWLSANVLEAGECAVEFAILHRKAQLLQLGTERVAAAVLAEHEARLVEGRARLPP